VIETTQTAADATTLVVVPARFGSRRLPGKAMLDIDGAPLVWHAYCRAREAEIGEVLVATDDPRILDAVRERGGRAVLTSEHCRNGTERVAEVVGQRPEVELVVDLQGDEPLIDPGAIVALWRAMASDTTLAMATVTFPLDGPGAMDDPTVVKAVLDERGEWAEAFWRLPVPPLPVTPIEHHAGIYAFRREALLELASLPPTPAEREHSLEQLRALAAGVRIRAVRVEGFWPSVNTHRDLELARRWMARRRGGAT